MFCSPLLFKVAPILYSLCFVSIPPSILLSLSGVAPSSLSLPPNLLFRTFYYFLLVFPLSFFSLNILHKPAPSLPYIISVLYLLHSLPLSLFFLSHFSASSLTFTLHLDRKRKSDGQCTWLFFVYVFFLPIFRRAASFVCLW